MTNLTGEDTAQYYCAGDSETDVIIANSKPRAQTPAAGPCAAQVRGYGPLVEKADVVSKVKSFISCKNH